MEGMPLVSAKPEINVFLPDRFFASIVMNKSLPISLARLHAHFHIFPVARFDATGEQNIIRRLSAIGELSYLCEFYDEYESEYRRAGVGEAEPLAGIARSTDLPFIGEEAIAIGHARFMFVFLGSLSEHTRLSTTVLSCLWPVESFRPIQSLFCMFWPTTYFNIVSGLGMTVAIAKNAYVVHAVRTHKMRDNRDLLRGEIDLLTPELVVLVGGGATRIIGSKALRAEPDRYFPVNFPNNGRNKRRIADDDDKFEKLRRRLKELELKDKGKNGGITEIR